MSWSSTVADYVAELRRLRPDRFLVAYPHPVLVHRFGSAPAGTVPPVARFPTHLLGPPAPVDVGGGGPRHLELSVHPVKKCPGNPYQDTVMLGRAATNDIVVAYTDLSKLHAYFTRAREGSWLFADAGSTNGTWLGPEQLDANTPVPLAEHHE